MDRTRLQALDWLRGLAVMVMVQTHAGVLLKPELRQTPLFQQIDRIDGLVAPAFLFAAGFSLALVQVRAGGGPSRVKRTLRRLMEVLFVATLINAIWFPVWREPVWLVRLDILHCVGLSLLIALPLLGALARRPRWLRWVTLGVGLVVFAIAPLFDKTGGAAAFFLNRNAGALFPLLPWAGYVYLGASAGATAASGGSAGLIRWLALLAALGVGVQLCRNPSFGLPDPAESAWRWSKVALLALGLVLVERRWPALGTAPPVRLLTLFGTSSLSAYFFHEILIYRPVLGFSFKAMWGERAGWGLYAALVLALLGCTYLLVVLFDRVYRWAEGAPRPASSG